MFIHIHFPISIHTSFKFNNYHSNYACTKYTIEYLQALIKLSRFYGNLTWENKAVKLTGTSNRRVRVFLALHTLGGRAVCAGSKIREGNSSAIICG